MENALLLQSLASALTISTLPNEILSEIFLHYVAGPLDVIHTIQLPLLVSSVSSHLRQVAVSTPRLWCRLFIKITLNRLEDDVNLVNTWLGRSGACPLQFSIVSSVLESIPDCFRHPALTVLSARSWQWGNMSLDLPLPAFYHVSQNAAMLSNLQEITLGTKNVSPDVLRTAGLPFIAFDAPKLRRLVCIGIPIHFLDLPWTHLQHVSVSSIPVDRCNEVLQRCTNISSAAFILGYRQADIHDYNRSLEHLQLTSLSLSPVPWCQPVNPKPILRLLRAPYLTHLEISGFISQFATDLLHFIESTPRLTSLSLSKLVVPSNELALILERLPNLEHLKLGPSRYTVTHPLIQRLEVRPQSVHQHWGCPPNICPNLRSLTIYLSVHLAHALVGILPSRMVSPNSACTKPLEVKVHVGRPGALSTDLDERIEALRRLGMVIEIDFYEGLHEYC